MTKKKDSSSVIVLAVVLLAAYLLLTGKFSIPGIGGGGGQPISTSGGGSPSIGICGKQQIGIGSDGIPITRDVVCQTTQPFAIFGTTEDVTYIYITATVTASPDTSFNDFEGYDIAATVKPVGVLSIAFDNGGNGRHSGPVPAGGSYTFSTLHFGPVGTTCGLWTTSCDTPYENRTFSTTNNRCECVLDANKFISDPNVFAIRIKGNYTYAGIDKIVTVTGSKTVSIKKDPSGQFAVLSDVIVA